MNDKNKMAAGITGCVAGIAGSFGFGAYFIAVPSILIFGTLVRARWRRPGTWIMWIGAIFLSFWTFPYGVGILLSPPPTDRSGLAVIFATIVTVLLVILCDVALAVEALKRRKG